MAIGLTDSQNYSAIADAIRTKLNTNRTLTPRSMAAAILSIVTSPKLQDKTVTPTTEIQVITADSGYDGLQSVTVGPMGDEVIYDAYATEFGETPIYPDKNYKINYNWFAELVSLARSMTGSDATLSPTEILAELSRVIFIPQGRANTVIGNSPFESDTWVQNPEYQSESQCVSFELPDESSFFTRAREMFTVPAVTACYEVESGTSLAGTVEASAGDWILATVTGRSELSYPDGWTLLKETPALNADNSNQRMAFLCKYMAEAGSVTVTVGQIDSARIYLNLMAFSGIGGFGVDVDSGYLSNRQRNTHTVTRPDGGFVVWGCSAYAWGSGIWECDEMNTPVVSLTSAGRQANFYDAEGGLERTFQNGTATTAVVIDYVKILEAS